MSTFVDYWLRANNPIFGLAPEKFAAQLDPENWQLKGLKAGKYYYSISDSCPQGRGGVVYAIEEYDCDTKLVNRIIVDDLNAALHRANELCLEKQMARQNIRAELSVAVGRKLAAALPVVTLTSGDIAIPEF